MFHRHEKKTKPAHFRPLHELTAISTPKVLLSEGKRPALIQNIIQSSALEISRFNSLYLDLLHRFTNQCQNLPETANNYYALPGGFLDHALNRAEAALHLLRQHMIQESDTECSEDQKRWIYALFSASILQGIGKLQLDFRIELFDVNGYFSRLWNPLLEELASSAKYHYEFVEGSEDDLRCRLNLLLAYQVMPASGFAWIAGNPQVLAAWLALLNEDPNDAGMLGFIFERANAIAIQRYLNEFLIQHTAEGGGGGARAGRINTFIDTTPESIAEKERVLGAQFIKWLNHGFKKGRFSINQLPFMLRTAGLQITTETYQLFMHDHPEVKNWQAIQKGIISLKLHNYKANVQKGLFLKKYAMALSDEVQLHDPVTGKNTTVSAIDVMRIQQSPEHPEPSRHLSASGEWLAAEENQAVLQTGFSRRE